MKKIIKQFMLTVTLVLLVIIPSRSMADDSPIKGGGSFGLGLELGDPGVWGAVGKIWVDRQNAFQPTIKLGNGVALLQLSYLWHDYDIIHPTQGLMPLYFGAGGGLTIQNTVAAEAHGVVGISYIFDKVNVPVDIYIQVEPTLGFYSGSTSFNVFGNLGSRYYF